MPLTLAVTAGTEPRANTMGSRGRGHPPPHATLNLKVTGIRTGGFQQLPGQVFNVTDRHVGFIVRFIRTVIAGQRPGHVLFMM